MSAISADRDRRPGDGVRPLLFAAADHPERQAADGDRRDDRAEPVEPAARVVSSAIPATWRQRDPQREGEDRDVDQEGDPPADRVHQQAADERAEQRQADVAEVQMPNARPRSVPANVWRDDRRARRAP